jgi:hypothetical protein
VEIKNEIVRKTLSLREASIDGWSDAISKARLVRDFMRHEPYSEKQKREAAEMAKPLIRYNVLVAKLLSLEGQELVNRRKTIFQPRYPSSSDLVNVISDHWDYLNNREELSTKLIRAMTDGLCYPTLGWLRRRIEFDDYGYLTFKWSNVDTFAVHPDPSFKELDLSDCGYVVVDDWMTKEQVNHMLKSGVFSDSEVRNAYQEVQARGRDELIGQHGKYTLIDGDRFLVCQLEEREYVSLDICSVDGEIMTLTSKEADKLEREGKEVDYIKSTGGERIKVTTVLPAYDLVLQDTKYNYDSTRFSLFACASYDWMMEKRLQPSLMYILTDVQDAISKAKSQHIDYMIQQLVEDYHIPIIEKQAIEDLETQKGKPHRIVRYSNINNRAIRSTGSQNASALQSIQNDIYMSLDFMSQISNITPVMEGRGGKSGESGTLFQAKLDRSITTTNPYFEIKAKANLLVAKDYLDLIKDVYFEDSRILEKNYDPKTNLSYEIINLNLGGISYNDVRTAKIDVVLDEGENTEVRLEESFRENLAMVQTMLNAGYPAEAIPWTNIIQNSNLRDKSLWLESINQGVGIMEMNAKEQLANNRLQQLSSMPVAPKQMEE